MNTTIFGTQPSSQSLARAARPTNSDFDRSTQRKDRDDQIVIHMNGHFDGTFALPRATQEKEEWDSDALTSSRRTASRRSSRSFTSRVSRQKSRRRELLERQARLDTSFTRHKGDAPHQVFPEDELHGNRLARKQSWFSVGRSSTKFKGLGITKGTPQPNTSHRRLPSIDHEPHTADSLAPAPGTGTWNEISPWDRPIPIGITIPTDSASDFSPYQGARQRSGSDITLVTPSIIITPAMPMQSVWSPDTPYTASDYTTSVYSRNTFNTHFMDHNIPPVPALPLGMVGSSGAPTNVLPAPEPPTHNGNGTLGSNGTAFEEYNDSVQRKDRVMSSDTFFEEDETPLCERTIETSLTVDTSLLPTPRRSQGWWNVITTPFVTTPLTATWPKGDHYGPKTPDVPNLPVQYSMSKGSPASLPTGSWTTMEKSPLANDPPSRDALPIAVPMPVEDHVTSRYISPNTVMEEVPLQATYTTVAQGNQQRTAATPDRNVTSAPSTMSATPVVATAAMATVLMPRQVEEPPRPININIELQDRRPDVNVQLLNTNSQPAMQQSHTSWPAPRLQGVGSYASRSNSPSPHLPTFAPPPTSAQKASRFSYDDRNRSSSQASTPDLKRQKKHRKVFDMETVLPCLKRKQQEKPEEKKKKKKRGCFFWCCGCCLFLVVLLAILIPIIVVFSRKKDGTTQTTPIATQSGGESTSSTSEWLTLTNYPPIPTGVLTIAQPEAVEEQSGCVAPTTLWSCALPKELQDSVKPNKPDQPNFEIEITFDNSSAATPSTTQSKKRAANAVSVGAFIRSRFLSARSVPSPSPAPPSRDDMVFLGETTDANNAPFDGEDTPLSVSFKEPQATASRLTKRAGSDPTNITAAIPAPVLNPDGTAAPANLLPFPSGQPLRLYNRGKENEHYGFYTYYDRTIFLKQINGTNRGGNPADTDGGSTEEAATLRCTFSETRFLVQIWTRSQASKPLLQNSTQSGSSDLLRPGTFPYPVTVTIDRHGGNAAKKNLYCYQMEDDGSIKNEASKRSFQFEDRAFGGNLVNGTQGRPNVSGPIDGGSGGCACKYQNWLD
ncbi:uncharacterized protein EKO05_0002054 [Ascochyta rabiei]|uniref:uncharacterized protein n=1 Tax=Didymella rabiei TaxID=5454 RepID=UPI0018FF87BA|nr:uncharacterized protein EKO05_0002054 [Ascochyta rabiei]UPX11448.1 hypothetical protein EKO05_0002054 [Ascochyta rabiei]